MNEPLIFFDVTHTLGHPHITGVQRVTRCLAAELATDPRVRLVRFDKPLQRFVVLTPAEVVTGTTNPAGSKDEAPPRRGSRYKRLVARLRPFAAFRTLASAKDWFIIHVVHTIQSSWARLQSQSLPSPLDGGIYLTPEVVGEIDRSKALRFMQKRRNLRLTFIVHDLIPLSHPQFSLVDRSDFDRYVGLLKMSQLLICDSTATRQQVLTRLQGRREGELRTEVVLPGFSPFPKGPQESPWLNENRPLVAWVGTVEPRKNQEAILPILQELWDAGLSFRFVFAGNRGRLGGDFAHRADALVRRGYPLVWIQGATEAQVHQLYRNASFTVYLSLVEGYGLPVLESLAEGTPCLTSSETSMAEIAESAGGCLLVDPTDRAAIKDGLGRLLRDEALLEALRRSIDLRRIPTWAEYKRQVSDLVTGNAYAEPRSQDSFLRNYQ